MKKAGKMMKKVVLFSPKGYVGGCLKESLQQHEEIQLYEITRDDDFMQYRETYDIMIYSASITSARQETAEKYVQDNVVTAVSMMDFCKEHQINKVIYLSSDEIYGDLNANIATEKAVMITPNLYAATKYLAEKIIMDSGISYYILRLPGIVGRTWGENFIYRLMEKIKNDEQIELYNINKQFNNILDVDDLVRFIVTLCIDKYNEKNEIFLLGNTEKVALKDIVFYMKELHHSTSVIHGVDTNQKRYFALDVENAVKYGYASKNIKTIIAELYEVQKG